MSIPPYEALALDVGIRLFNPKINRCVNLLASLGHFVLTLKPPSHNPLFNVAEKRNHELKLCERRQA